MEKIYIENNNQNNNKNFLHSKSVLGTFALAIIAVIAIVIVGVNQTSYAIPEVTNPLPDTFTTAEPGDSIFGEGSENAKFPVEPYKTTDGTIVFCMEHGVDFKMDTTFNKSEAISDYGLLYLMAHIYPHVKFKAANGTELAEPVQVWLSQVAIWLYLADMYPDNPNYSLAVPNTMTAEEALSVIKNTRGIYVDQYSIYKADGTTVVVTPTTGATFYDTYLVRLLAEAKEKVNKPNKILKVNKTDTISVTSDEKYYQTSQISITVTPEENFNGYSVKLDSVPDGSFIVDENGNKIEDSKLTNMSKDSKFYIRVPIDKVNEKNKTIKFSITGSFTTYEGNYYKADGAQTIATVETVKNNIQTGAEIPLNYTPDVPDTGLSTAQTVYFIGLIVLLSGIGIIYANVKPSESK